MAWSSALLCGEAEEEDSDDQSVTVYQSDSSTIIIHSFLSSVFSFSIHGALRSGQQHDPNYLRIAQTSQSSTSHAFGSRSKA